jgi:radical SAM superfamily enzyme YgiQ (UPF0313 family)
MPPQHGLLSGFSTGLISLANYVEMQRLPALDTRIVDLSVLQPAQMKKEIRRSVEEQEEMIIGISTTTATYQSALETARVFKRAYPHCTIIFGGHHASNDPETILRSHKKTVDYIIVGEGERALVEFVEKFPRVQDVHGLAYLSNGEFMQNDSPEFLTSAELDEIPMTFRGNGIHTAPGKFGHITYVSARGCPRHCSFCSVSGEEIRTKGIHRITQELRQLVGNGYCSIAIEDNFFAQSRRRTNELCAALTALRKEGLEFSWDCQTRVESLDHEGVVPLLASAGCEAVYLGVESLNPSHLTYLGKTGRPLDYLHRLLNKVVPLLLDSSINCYLNLQFGIPGETSADRKRTYETLKQLGALASSRKKTITIFPQLHVVYPGTKHFKDGIHEGRFPKDTFETFTEWEAKQTPVLTWLGEHFAHGTGGLPEGILLEDKLRKGRYEVSVNKVLGVSTSLSAIDRIKGIEVFKYGSYLVGP